MVTVFNLYQTKDMLVVCHQVQENKRDTDRPNYRDSCDQSFNIVGRGLQENSNIWDYAIWFFAK